MPRLRGNLHTHSTLSDGALDPVEIARRYRAKGYDFIAFTDHRCFLGDGGSQAYWARLPPSEDGFLILRGVEEEPESLGGRHMGVIQGDTEDLRIINHPNEYGLTVDEACEAVRLADAHAMLPAAHPAYPPEPTTWRADGCLIRSDGLRLIFEVVHTVNSDQWSRKLAKWVDTLGAGSRSDSGAVLILLNAVLPEEHHRAERKIRKAVRDTLDAADPNVAARARTQIVCASWREWFPAPYQIGPAFCDLSASYWSGSKWRRVSLSDPEASRFDAPGFGDGLRLADLSYARPPWAP